MKLDQADDLPIDLHNNAPVSEGLADILDNIFPAREFSEDGDEWVQDVSKWDEDREAVQRLQRLLEEKLIQRQARMIGICQVRTVSMIQMMRVRQVRRELYSQCFDEIIRQTTIICLERGLLLLRMRDEFRMTMIAAMVGLILQIFSIKLHLLFRLCLS